MMKRLIIGIACCLATVSVSAQIVSLNDSEVKALKKAIDQDKRFERVVTPFMNTAQSALNEQPNPIPVILSQGILEGDPRKTATQKALRDIPRIYSLAVAYRIKGQKEYLDKAAEYLLAWAQTNHSEGDPINDTKLEDVIFAYDLIRNQFGGDQRQKIDAWLDQTAQAEVDSKSAKPGRGTAINNWNSHRIKIITLIAYALHTEKYDNIIKTELEKQLEVNLNADGTTHDFIERDAFHYHTYDLEPLLSTIIAINRKTGKNYFTYQTSKGASVKKCVDFMVPYMTGEKTHGEFMNSTVPFDRQRAQNHEKGYEAGTPFEPRSGINTLSLAAYFDTLYIAVIKKAANNDDYFNWQLALDQIREKAGR